MADELGQQLLELLDSERRQVVDAILSRSDQEYPSARCLDLALALIHVRAEGAVACLLSTLERSVVHVLIGTPDDWSSVLVLDDEAGQGHLAVFTSAEQAQIAVQDYGASYENAPIDVVVLCQSLGGEAGLAMNPHDEVLAFELPPDIVRTFRAAVAQHGVPEVGVYYSVLASLAGYQCARIDSIEEKLALTWIETEWPMRPAHVSEAFCALCPSQSCEVSGEAFSRWQPLRITHVLD